MKDHNYLIKEITLQNCLVPRNERNQPMKLGHDAALRAVRKLKSHVLGDHKYDVKEICSMAETLQEKGYGCDILWSDVGDHKSYEGFMYAHLPAIKSEVY